MDEMEELEILNNIKGSAARLIKWVAREYKIYDVESFKCPRTRELAKNLMPVVKDLLPPRPPDQPPSKGGGDNPYKDGGPNPDYKPYNPYKDGGPKGKG